VNPLPLGSLTANGPFCVTGAGELTWTATTGSGPYTIVYSDGSNNHTVSGIENGAPFAVAVIGPVHNYTFSFGY